MYTEESIEVFLKEQGRLYDEPVAETVEEAEELQSKTQEIIFFLLRN